MHAEVSKEYEEVVICKYVKVFFFFEKSKYVKVDSWIDRWTGIK